MARWPGWTPWRRPMRYGTYIQKYPTHFHWRPKTRRVCRILVRRFNVSVNSYYRHPPPTRRWERVSLDVWGRRGRGYYLPPKVGRRVWSYLWRHGNRWQSGIYRGRWYRPHRGWSGSPPGPPDSDPRHDAHIHLTEAP